MRVHYTYMFVKFKKTEYCGGQENIFILILNTFFICGTTKK